MRVGYGLEKNRFLQPKETKSNNFEEKILTFSHIPEIVVTFEIAVVIFGNRDSGVEIYDQNLELARILVKVSSSKLIFVKTERCSC